MPLICVASPNGGVGRTTLAANIARLLVGLMGGRIVALDLDAQNTLGLHFGLDLRDAFGFLATLRYAADGRAAWRAALRSSPSGVSYLPHGLVGLEGANAISTALSADPEILTASVREMLSLPNVTVVADLPAGFSPALAAILPVTDLLVVPFLGDAVSMSQLPMVESGRLTGGFGQDGRPGLPPERVAFVVNQLDVRTRLGRATADTAVLHLGARLLGVVHRDEHVPEAVAAQRLVVDVTPEARASQEIAAVASAIVARLTST
jgi:cellulose synthase operon protein YhjQ